MSLRHASSAPARNARFCSAGNSTVMFSSALADSITATRFLEVNTCTRGPRTPALTAQFAASAGSGDSSLSV